jgi:membrane associated rhomboid family serine protease
MTQNAPKPMSIGLIFVIIILTAVVVGALLGILRTQTGGSALLSGGLAGFVVGLLASFLYRRRVQALRSQTEC